MIKKLNISFLLTVILTGNALSDEINFKNIAKSPDFVPFGDVFPEPSQKPYECIGFKTNNECDDYFHVIRNNDQILKVGILRLRENDGALIKAAITGKIINGYLCANYGKGLLSTSNKKTGESGSQALINVLRPSFAKFGTVCSAYFSDVNGYRIEHFNKHGKVEADFLPKLVRFQAETPKLYSLFESGRKS